MPDQPVQQEEQQEHCRHDQNQPHIDLDKMSLLNRFFGSASFRIRGFSGIGFLIKC